MGKSGLLLSILALAALLITNAYASLRGEPKDEVTDADLRGGKRKQQQKRRSLGHHWWGSHPSKDYYYPYPSYDYYYDYDYYYYGHHDKHGWWRGRDRKLASRKDARRRPRAAARVEPDGRRRPRAARAEPDGKDS